MKDADAIALSGILVHWYDEAGACLAASMWPEDPRFELIVVDNGSDTELDVPGARVLRPQRNLGYAGAINLGLRHSSGPVVLVLNADVQPGAGALHRLLEGLELNPDAAGLAPRLVGPDGRAQHRWQLRALPSLRQLLLQASMLPVWSGPRHEPRAGSPVEQPAGAALALRRNILDELGGFDESFFPAWYEDVDLATRLKNAGHSLLYWPSAQFVHEMGSSVSTLGYGRFLWIHYRNLCHYLTKHHGPTWSLVARALLVPTSLARIALLPIRKPQRADTRGEAFEGLLNLLAGALSGWRLPSGYPIPSGRRLSGADGNHE